MSDSSRDRWAGRVPSFVDERRDDSIVRCWDALLEGDFDAATAESPASVALIEQVRALDDALLPHDAFLDRLQQELGKWKHSSGDMEPRTAGLPGPSSVALTSASVSVIDWGNVPSVRRTRGGTRFNPLLGPMRAAAAVLAVVLIAGLLVLYRSNLTHSEPPAIPAAVIAEPTIEPITQFEFVPSLWGMPDATEWDFMEMSLLNIAPASSFTTDWPWYLATDGPLMLTVLTGELSVTPAGPAYFYPANQPGRPPVEVQAGETVFIRPNDTIVYSSVDTAAGSNPGSEPAIVMNVVIGKLDKMLPGHSVIPKDVTFIAHEYDKALVPTISTAGATLTLQRLQLAPFDTFVFDPDPDLRYLPFIDPADSKTLRIEEGALDGIFPNPGAQSIYAGYQLRYLKHLPHTIFNLGDQTVEFFFLVAEPSPDVATPPA